MTNPTQPLPSPTCTDELSLAPPPQTASTAPNKTRRASSPSSMSDGSRDTRIPTESRHKHGNRSDQSPNKSTTNPASSSRSIPHFPSSKQFGMPYPLTTNQHHALDFSSSTRQPSSITSTPEGHSLAPAVLIHSGHPMSPYVTWELTAVAPSHYQSIQAPGYHHSTASMNQRAHQQRSRQYANGSQTKMHANECHQRQVSKGSSHDDDHSSSNNSNATTHSKPTSERAPHKHIAAAHGQSLSSHQLSQHRRTNSALSQHSKRSNDSIAHTSSPFVIDTTSTNSNDGSVSIRRQTSSSSNPKLPPSANNAAAKGPSSIQQQQNRERKSTSSITSSGTGTGSARGCLRHSASSGSLTSASSLATSEAALRMAATTALAGARPIEGHHHHVYAAAAAATRCMPGAPISPATEALPASDCLTGCSPPSTPNTETSTDAAPDLERFLDAVNPVVLLPDSLEAIADLRLSDVWSFYEQPSAFGLECLTLGGPGGPSNCYFVPFLSALQLFEPVASVNKTENKEYENSIAHSTNDNRNNTADTSCTDVTATTTTKDDSTATEESNAAEDIFFYPQGLDSWPSIMHRCFSWSVDDHVAERVPFTEQLEELCDDLGSAHPLHASRILDLHPYSWFAVAWYPLYRIPEAPLTTRFLTFHSIAPLWDRAKAAESELQASSPSTSASSSLCFSPHPVAAARSMKGDPSEEERPPTVIRSPAGEGDPSSAKVNSTTVVECPPRPVLSSEFVARHLGSITPTGIGSFPGSPHASSDATLIIPSLPGTERTSALSSGGVSSRTAATTVSSFSASEEGGSAGGGDESSAPPSPVGSEDDVRPEVPLAAVVDAVHHHATLEGGDGDSPPSIERSISFAGTNGIIAGQMGEECSNEGSGGAPAGRGRHPDDRDQIREKKEHTLLSLPAVGLCWNTVAHSSTTTAASAPAASGALSFSSSPASGSAAASTAPGGLGFSVVENWIDTLAAVDLRFIPGGINGNSFPQGATVANASSASASAAAATGCNGKLLGIWSGTAVMRKDYPISKGGPLSWDIQMEELEEGARRLALGEGLMRIDRSDSIAELGNDIDTNATESGDGKRSKSSEKESSCCPDYDFFSSRRR